MRLLLRSTHGLTPQTRPLAGRAFAELKRRAKEQLRSVRKRSISSLELDTQKEAPFLKTEAVKHLGVNAQAFGGKFDARVRALAQKGLGIRAIARVLKVAHTTVLERIKRSRKGKPKRRRGKISSPM